MVDTPPCTVRRPNRRLALASIRRQRKLEIGRRRHRARRRRTRRTPTRALVCAPTARQHPTPPTQKVSLKQPHWDSSRRTLVRGLTCTSCSATPELLRPSRVTRIHFRPRHRVQGLSSPPPRIHSPPRAPETNAGMMRAWMARSGPTFPGFCLGVCWPFVARWSPRPTGLAMVRIPPLFVSRFSPDPRPTGPVKIPPLFVSRSLLVLALTHRIALGSLRVVVPRAALDCASVEAAHFSSLPQHPSLRRRLLSASGSLSTSFFSIFHKLTI